MSRTLGLLAAVDALYAGVVTEPERWTAQALEDWAGDLAAGDPLDRNQVRAIRACLRNAARLRDFWSGPAPAVEADEWQARVDVAMGPRAWRPTLELAMEGLQSEPSAELFDEVKNRFRIVASEHWMDGVSYDEWLISRGAATG